jgi:hypothetical protein
LIPLCVLSEMKDIKPMGSTSTPFISYHEIDVKETDLLEDAWGLNSGFSDVIEFLGEFNFEPGDELISRVIELLSEPN